MALAFRLFGDFIHRDIASARIAKPLVSIHKREGARLNDIDNVKGASARLRV
jgi:hypothetical protein